MEEKKPIKSKYRNYDILIYIVLIVLAYFLGVNVYSNTGGVYGSDRTVFAIVGILVGFFVATITYEIGKLIFGKISSLNLISINIFGLTFKRVDGKLKFCFEKLENYGGKTVMACKKVDRSLPVLYFLGGSIFTVIAFVGLIFLGIYLTNYLNDGIYQYIFYMASCVALIVILLNMVPFYAGALLDGFVLRLITSKENKEAYFHYIYNLGELNKSNGSLLLYTSDSIDDFFTSKAYFQNYYYYLLNNDVEKAKEVLQKCIEIIDLFEDDEIKFIQAEHLYFLITENKLEEAQDYYSGLDSSLRRKISNGKKQYFKTSILIPSMIEVNYDNFEYLMAKYEHSKFNYLPLLKDIETKMMEDSFDKIRSYQVEWFTKESDI